MFSDKNQRIIKTNNDKYTHDGGTKTSAHFVGFFFQSMGIFCIILIFAWQEKFDRTLGKGKTYRRDSTTTYVLCNF